MRSTEDVNQVKVGRLVQVRIDAYPYTDYGTLAGQVSAISPDAVTRQKGNAELTGATSSFEVAVQPTQQA